MDFASSTTKAVNIIHFNDVYNVEDSRGSGGAARFVGGVKRVKNDCRDSGTLEPLVLFSGDGFSPSMLSTITRGRHMPPFFNAIGVDVALCGNHDFDFGVEQLVSLIEKCNFPWLLSNVIDKSTSKPLAGAHRYLVLPPERCGGVKVGIIGLVEIEWIATLSTIEMADVDALDPIAEGNRLAAILRDEHGCDIIIALTHARLYNDRRMAKELRGVDIILGGHDHDYHTEMIGDVPLIKSGTDFRSLR